MMSRLLTVARAVVDEALGLFVADWRDTLLVVAVVAAAAALVPHLAGAAIGFGTAAAIAAIVAGSAIAAGRPPH